MFGAPPFPPPLPLDHTLHRAPARPAAETLQGRTPRSFETHIAARTIAASTENNSATDGFVLPPADCPSWLRPSFRCARARGNGPQPPAASSGPSPSAGTAAGLSTATSAAPFRRTPRDTRALRPDDGGVRTPITRCPRHVIGPAPQRFIVKAIADQKSRWMCAEQHSYSRSLGAHSNGWKYTRVDEEQ
jgi:hypothetical protein